jgi:hypothetical protein
VSFDVFFQPCRFVVTPRPGESHPSRTPVDARYSEPLTPIEEEAVRGILVRASPRGCDEHGCWVVEVADGGSAEVFVKDLGTSCTFALRGVTPALVRLMFDILVAGNWVILPALERSGAIAASMDAIRGVPEGFPDVVVCETADALGALLSGGVEAWAKFRARASA